MADIPRGEADLNKTGVEFLIIDLDTALTFLDLAETSATVEIKERNYEKARIAYDTVTPFLGELSPDAKQRMEIDLKLAELKIVSKNRNAASVSIYPMSPSVVETTCIINRARAVPRSRPLSGYLAELCRNQRRK